MKEYLSRTVLLSTLLVAIAATSEFWTEAFGFEWWFMAAAGGSAGLANLFLLGRAQSFKKERQEFFLDQTCGQQFQALRQFDSTVRVNIMVTSLVWKGRPRRGLTFFKAYGFENHADQHLKLLFGEGVAGNAVKKEMWAVGRRDEGAHGTIHFEDGAVIPDIDYDMDTAQKTACTHLQLICSYPIRKLMQRGNEVLAAGKIIGVINIDSQKTADEWHAENRLIDLIQRALPGLATAAANILD